MYNIYGDSVKNHAKNNKDACFSPLLPKATETDAI